jgi:glucose-6-phosphate isomerase, archaeal
MKHLQILPPSTVIDPLNWFLRGSDIAESEKRMKHLTGVFKDIGAFEQMDPEQLVYNVQAHLPVPEGTSGGLYFGTTIVQPGKVGREYFMTRGHFHALEDRAEYYWGVQGEGMLILMNRERESWAERMFPGSLHYIRGGVAHRIANTGAAALIIGASWPSDAGHNYDEISQHGFSARLLDVADSPTLIPE